MTTIATDGKSMAADGRVTVNGRIITDTATKLNRLADGRVVACCGDTSDSVAFMAWLEAGRGDMLAVGDDFGALVMSANGVDHYDADLSPVRADLPVTMGSGGAIALGAMMAGVGPFEAVKIAARRDCYTGGVFSEMARR